MKTIRYSLFFLLVLTFAAVRGQDAATDLAAVDARLQKAKTVRMEYEMRLYARPEGGEPVEESSCALAQKGALRYEKLLGMEILRNQEALVLADHRQQYIFTGKAADFPVPAFSEMSGAALRPLLEAASGVESLPAQAGERRYLMRFNRGDYEAIEVRIATGDFTLRAMTLYFAAPVAVSRAEPTGKPRIELIYGKVLVDQPIGREVFSTERICTIRDGQVTPAPAFAHYEVLN